MKSVMTTVALGAALTVSLSAVSWAQGGGAGAGGNMQSPESSTTTNNGAGLPGSGALQDGTSGNPGNGGPTVNAPTGTPIPKAAPGRRTTGPTDPSSGAGTVGRGSSK
jgi:hypothetical protein